MAKNNPIIPKELQGAYTALITPMLPGDGLTNSIHYDKLFRLISDQYLAGIRGIVIAGTTGQSATLDHKEQVRLVKMVFDHVKANYGDNLQVIPSAGSNCTREAIELSQAIEEAIGPSTLLHVTGYYNNPTQAGIKAHFEALAKRIQGNIIMYSVPGRTNSNIDPATAIALSKNKKIIGLKAAGGETRLKEVKEIIENCSDDFRVLSGDDGLVAEVMSLGGRGVISASANGAPNYFFRIVKQASSPSLNYDKAREIQAEINPFVDSVFCVKNPIPLAHMFHTEVRLPLVKETDLEERIKAKLNGKVYTPEQLGINFDGYNY